MPGMDGFTLLKKLQEEIITQSVPVILITSLSAAHFSPGFLTAWQGTLRSQKDYIPLYAF